MYTCVYSAQLNLQVNDTGVVNHLRTYEAHIETQCSLVGDTFLTVSAVCASSHQGAIGGCGLAHFWLCASCAEKGRIHQGHCGDPNQGLQQ